MALLLPVALVRMELASRRRAHAKVVAVGEALLRRHKGNAALQARLCAAYWSLSRWKDAIRAGRRALAVAPERPKTVVYVLAAYRELNPGAGIAFGEGWLARRRPTAEIHRHLSFLYDDLDRPQDALRTARAGLDLDATNVRLAACVANYLAKTEGAAAALAFASPREAQFQHDPYCANTLAQGLASAGAYGEAASRYSRLHQQSPGDAALFVSLLDALYHDGRHEDVLAAVEGWTRTRAVTAPIANEAGRAHLERGRYDEALNWMERAVQLSAGSPRYADNLAIMLGRAGRYARSIEACRQRLEVSGADRRRLLKSIAVNHTCLGQHAAALPVYEQAFAEFPDDPETLINVMVGLSWLNRHDDEIAFAARHRADRGPALPPRYWSEYAWALHQAQRFDEEQDVLAEWRRLHPDDVEAVRASKRVLNQVGRPDEALELVGNWVEAHRHVAWGWRYLAEQHETCGNPETELAAIEEACRLMPDDADFAAEHVAILRRQQQSRRALDVGLAWLRAHPALTPPVLLNRIGLAADDLENWSVAEAHFRQAHSAAASDPTYLANLLRALICQRRAGEAANLGAEWLRSNVANSHLAVNYAWALRATGRLEDEETYLRSAVAAHAGDDELNHALLTNLIGRKETEAAGAHVASCDSAGHASSRLFNDWGNHLRDIERTADAEAAYHRALALSPDNDVAAGNLASLWIHAGRGNEAVAFCREWLTRRPTDRYLRRQLANACYTIDEFETAEAEYARLLEADPDSAFLFGRYIACLRLLGRFDDALTQARVWLGAHAGTTFLYIEMGIAAHRLNRLDEALACYEEALKLDPGSCAAAVRKLRLLKVAGKLRDAVTFAETWAAEHPDAGDPEFHNDLGIALDRLGRVDAAERHFLRASAAEPNNPVYAGNVVEILARRGELSQSVQLGQAALAHSPPDAYLLRRLAEVYSLRNEHAAALDLLQTADALDPADIEIAVGFLGVAAESGELERGIEFGRQWLDRPGNQGQAAVWARFARLCFRADRDEEAFAGLARAIELEPGEIAHTRLRFAFLNAADEPMRVVTEFDGLAAGWREDPHLLRQLSRAYHALGLGPEALSTARHNVDVNPGDEEAFAWLAELHEQSGRVPDARECLAHWIRIHGEHPAVMRVRARLSLREEQPALALADAEKVLAHDPTDEDTFVVLIRALRALDRSADARKRLHHWLEHHDTSPQISQLFDEELHEDGG